VAVLAGLGAVGGAALAARPAPPPPPPVPAQAAGTFQDWVRRMEARGIQVSAGLWDLSTGKALESHQPDTALVPASVTKVVSTYAMLRTWKPDYQLETTVYGDLQNGSGVVKGDLVLRGGGDPYLTTERIFVLAQDLKRLGVQRVTGRLRLDQAAFDAQRYGNGWENTTSNTTPPVLPLSVNFNRDDRGNLVSDPERLALEVLGQVFMEAGIVVENGPETGRGGQRKLLDFKSPPLRMLIQDINKFSNNFMTEMLVKRFGEGSWPRGIARIQAFYKEQFGLGPDRIAITDGSGLSKRNLLSAKTLAIVLRGAVNDFEVGPEMVASLKIIGGEPWKLRIKDPNLARRVRCKTGHLSGVTTVCGLLQTPDGKQRVFAILLNGDSREDDAWEQVSRWAN
jgi:D-alanyl-D-alanine carboxypeptidase/D-alanyl-D-alanine-endopeptidase (penicillin-binding protein 4)